MSRFYAEIATEEKKFAEEPFPLWAHGPEAQGRKSGGPSSVNNLHFDGENFFHRQQSKHLNYPYVLL